MNTAKANYNMSFDKGSFCKNQAYQYWHDVENDLVHVTTDQGEEQDFLFSEFDALFTFFF